MKEMNFDILGISETRWTDNGEVTNDGHVLVYSGGDEHRNGVEILMKQRIAASMMGYWPITERIMMVKFKTI